VPDLERLAFDRTVPGLGTDVWIMNVGESPRRLTTAASRQMFPAFSADGLRVAYSSEQLYPPRLAIFTINVDGSGGAPLVQQVTNDEFNDVRWSADGRLIAYTHMDGIWLHDVTANTDRRLTPEGVHASWPSFNGNEVYFSRLTGTGARQIWHINIVTSALGRYGRTPDGADQPAWVRNADVLFYTYNGNIEKVDGGRTFPNFIPNASQAAPSPSGHRLAFVRNGQIWTTDIDGNFLVQASGGPSDAHPVWSVPIPQ
jgi:Tol biopolymer transport system component